MDAPNYVTHGTMTTCVLVIRKAGINPKVDICWQIFYIQSTVHIIPEVVCGLSMPGELTSLTNEKTRLEAGRVKSCRFPQTTFPSIMFHIQFRWWPENKFELI